MKTMSDAGRRIEARRGPLHIESPSKLSDDQIDHLVRTIALKPSRTEHQLLSRAPVVKADLPGVGPVAIKRYLRGGLARYALRRFHFGIGTTRAHEEFNRLERLAASEVSVPEPVALVWRGFGLYEAWLITKYVENSMTLAELSTVDDERTRSVLPAVVEEVEKLIRQRVFHIDLHPGNVLVSPSGQPFIIDFDKARDFVGNLNTLRDRYLVRWRRAIIKHRLPAPLVELFCAGMRQNFIAI